MNTPAHLTHLVVWWGLVFGLVFGAVGYRTNFCTMGSVSDIVNMGDWTRMRMWLLAIAVAIIGANVLQLKGDIDLSQSIYTAPNFTWLAYIVGGLFFGMGMTLGSGCASKTMIRIGGGNLKSLVVFVFLGISAYMTLTGIFAVWRVHYIEPFATTLSTDQDLPSMLAKATGMAPHTMQIVLTAIIGGGLALFALAKKDFWQFDNLLGGIVIGLMVVGAWYVSGHIGYSAEDPNTLAPAFYGTNSGHMESLSYVAPTAYTLQMLMLFSDGSEHLTLGISSLLGIILGSFLYALVTRKFRVESFTSPSDLVSHMVGGIFMGFGGVTALGCTIGQGVSGFSTLSLGSIIAFLSICAGAAIMMKLQYWWMMREDTSTSASDVPQARSA